MKISAEAVRQSPALQRSETKSLSQIKTLNMWDHIRNFYAWVTIEIIKWFKTSVYAKNCFVTKESTIPTSSLISSADSAIRLSQRRYKASDWSEAWRRYLGFTENEKFERLGLGQKLQWDEEPEEETFVHIHPPPQSLSWSKKYVNMY